MTGKIIAGAMRNCRAQSGPENCRYHSKQFVAHPLAAQYASLAEKFIEVEASLSPNLVIRNSDASTQQHSQAVVDFILSADRNEQFFSDEEKHAIYRYSDEYGSRNIRTVLLNPEKKFTFNQDSMDQIHSRINALDGVIASHGEDVSGLQLWRGVSDFKFELSDAFVGNTVHLPSFTSTSVNVETALSFSEKQHPILLRIKAPHGLKLNGSFGGEQEVLLPRGSSFVVSEIIENVHVEKSKMRAGESPYFKGITLVDLTAFN